VSVEIVPVEGLPDIRPGDELSDVLAEPLRAHGVRDGDVVAVTSKIVSKSEGRLVPGEDRAGWVARETARVVARRGDLVIAETAHGFVCANAGVDASNLQVGTIALLPDDPDASAERIRAGLYARLGVEVAIVVTDTFGRAWRTGLVNVAIGAAGLPSVVDLRGTRDHEGRELEATIVAFADEIASASGLVMGKAARVPVAIVRGARPALADAPATPARALIRPPDEDLFRESPEQALHARRTIRSFAPGSVPRETVEDAVRAACTAPAPHHTRPWLFVALESDAARKRLLTTMAETWRADLRADGTSDEIIDRRIERSNGVLGEAPLLIVPFVRFEGAHPYPDAERAGAEREMFLLSGGAAIQNLLLALHARRVASCWISSTLFCQDETREALGVEEGWHALGTVAAGPMPEGGASRPRPPLDVPDVLRSR
jgi:coenzyme F420-0:L-glutamate ligase / coenzyme F420-1:gamma-L-glutamate ligase